MEIMITVFFTGTMLVLGMIERRLAAIHESIVEADNIRRRAATLADLEAEARGVR